MVIHRHVLIDDGGESFDLDNLLRWRDQLDFVGPVFAGVLVIASANMAKVLTETTDQIVIPPTLISSLDHDREAGASFACELMDQIRASGAFDGIHLVPVGKFRTVAAQLEGEGWRR